MRLIEQILHKKLELSEEFIINRYYLRAIWHFYGCYNLSLALLKSANVLDIKDKKMINRRNRLWKKLLLGYKKLDEKKFKKIQEIMNKDKIIIIKALNYLNKQAEDPNYTIGDFYRKGYIGIQAWEFPE